MNEVLQAVWAIAPGIIVGVPMTAGLAGINERGV